MNGPTWIDGRPVASFAASAIDSLHRATAYGDGLFETIAVIDGRARLLSLHLDRLRAGCHRLAIDVDENTLREEIQNAVAKGREGVLKIIVARAGAERGYRAQPAAGSHRLLQFFSQTIDNNFAECAGAILHLCRQRLSQQPVLAGLKHLNRLEQVLARSEWCDPGITEGLMLDTHAHVIEAVSSNIFWVRDGEVFTPVLQQCGVAGVMRRVVMEYLQITVQEKNCTLDDLYAAQEIFITNSLRGIQPVVQLGCVHWSRGSVTIALQQQLQNFLSKYFS